MDCCFWCFIWSKIVAVRRLNRTELNIKNYIVKAKHEIITHRIEHIIGDMELLPTGIIPLINKAWVNSFSEVEPNKKNHCRTWSVTIQSRSSYAPVTLQYYDHARY